LFLRWRFALRGRELEAVRAVDTATDPRWQRQGLFRRLTLELVERLTQQGVAFVFNTPNAKSRAGYLAMGWTDVGRLPLLVRPRWNRLLASLADLGGGPDLAPVEELLRLPELPAFLRTWSSSTSLLCTVRDVPYLGWRYARAPGLQYRAAWHVEGDSGVVVVVRERERHGRSELSFSEVLVCGGDETIRRATDLVRTIAGSTGDYAAALGSPGLPERRVLRRAGFLPMRGLAPRMTWRPLAADVDAAPMEHCRLAAGDIELF
jgi:hypothetical protein